MKRFLYSVATDQVHGFFVGIVKIVLWVLSCVFALLIKLRAAFYAIGSLKRHKLSVPVISVGNLTVGGVGKTPLVELIARTLKGQGLQPAILMRGYMGEGKDISHSSDEALMLKNALVDVPVLVGTDRVKSATSYLEKNKVNVFLLDDGFQHWRLSRDIDIVVIDALNPWGNGHLLPRGILRESCHALLRAHMFVLTKTDLGRANLAQIRDDLESINPDVPIIETVHQPVSFLDERSGVMVELSEIQGRQVCSVCSIGAPDSFAKTLKNLGADISKRFAFMDHHSYRRDDIEHIIKSCEGQSITTVVTTQKDAVKLKTFLDVVPGHIRVLSLSIKMSIVSGEDVFLEQINRLL